MSMRERASGFTIVELLVVVVIVGILATISILAYIGVSQQASDASLKVDTENAGKVLNIDYVNTGSYPATAGAANGGKGLPSSNGTTYSYTVDNNANPPTYSLRGSSPRTTNSYIVTSVNNVPTLVTSTLPVITLQPESWINYSHTFTSAATGLPSPTVQWQRSADQSVWTNISGATNPNLTTSDTIGCGRIYFRALYTNTAGTTTTNVAYLEGPCGD